MFHRHPVAQSTDCVRTLTSYSSGLHAFKLSWRTRQRGTHVLVGVATQDAALHATGQQLVGLGDREEQGVP